MRFLDTAHRSYSALLRRSILSGECHSLACTTLVLCCVVLAGPRAGAQATDAEAAAIRQMTAAGLPEAAVAYAAARTRFAIAEGDGELAAKWTMRAMEATSLAARHSPGQASQLDEKREQFFASFIEAFPKHRRQPWLDWQVARCQFLRAQSELAVYLAAPANTAAQQSTLELIREVQSACEKLKTDIRRRLAVASAESPRGGVEAPSDSLMQLSLDADLLLSEALLLRAQAYPHGSQDYQAAMGQVDLLATEALQNTAAGWTGQEKLQLARAAAGLALGRQAESNEKLRSLAATASTDTARNQAAWVLIDSLLRLKQTSQARQYAQLLPASSPLSALAEIKVRIAEAEQLTANRREEAMRRILDLARQVKSQHGDYWQNRADALVTRTGSPSADSTPNSPDLMQLQVKQLLAAGKTEEAITALRQRLSQDTAQAESARAIATATQLAALQFRQGDVPAAIKTAQTTAWSFKDTTSAATLHRFALALMQAALAKNLSDTELAMQYTDALTDHLAAWPDHKTSRDVMDWMQRWQAPRGNYASLLKALQARAEASREAPNREETLWLWTQVASRATPAARRPAVKELMESKADGARSFATLVQNVDQWLPDQQRASQLAELNRSFGVSALAPTRSEPALVPAEALLAVVRTLEQVRKQDLTHVGSVADAVAQLPIDISRLYLTSLSEAIDLTGVETRSAWAKALGLDDSIANICIESKQPAQKAVGYRMLQWLNASDYAKNAAELESLRKSSPRNGLLLLQVAESLAERPETIDASSGWARTVAANSPAQSNLHWRAQWRRINNKILQGKAKSASQAASLLLATSTPEDEVWLARLKRISQQ